MNKPHEGRDGLEIKWADGLAVKWAEVRAARRAGIIAFSDIVDAYVSGFDAATEIHQKCIDSLESELSTQVDLISCENCEEVERRLEKLREALKKIQHYQHGIPGTYCDPVVIAAAAPQEETK